MPSELEVSYFVRQLSIPLQTGYRILNNKVNERGAMSEKHDIRFSDELDAEISKVAARDHEGNYSEAVKSLVKDGIEYRKPRPHLSDKVQKEIVAESMKAFDVQTGGMLMKFLKADRQGFAPLNVFLSILILAMLIFVIHFLVTG